ncbi:MAG: sugar ABC transporter ATP-binding protein [Planctomycetota bacterium]|nr:sugar ABC transporter ATP-binding protein [Planctomycetota bacterium]
MACQLQTENIRKEYPGTVALDNVSVSFDGGKVHALIGKNGAGKSTLVKIFAGAVQPTSGRILVDGQPVVLRSPRDAFAQGIATVYQEMSLVPGLSVAENILLGRLPHKKVLGASVIDWPAVFARARAVLDGMQVSLDVRRQVGDLGMAQQQIVEIAKAMSFNPSVIMFDEPTSALAQHETQTLFGLIRTLAAKGVVIVYITHRLQELPLIADTVTVVRDGRYIGTAAMAQATPQTIVQMMFGEVVQKERPADLKAGTEPVLQVRGLGQKGKFHDVNFTLYRGEVLGIAGMLGSGRTELLRALFGAEAFDAGEIVIGGRSVRTVTPSLMKDLGVAFTPENRKEQALVQILSTRANLCLASLDRISTLGFTTRRRERSVVNRLVARLSVRMPDTEQPVSSLSGGNQQKVVVGKWLNTEPRVILFDEPTRGIDVQAKQQIFQIMWDLSRQGISSLFVSSELEELLEVCHRILIMKKGTLRGEVQPGTLSVDELFVRCMTDE